MDSIDEDDYELEDGFADRGEAPPLQEQVMSIVQLMNELWKNCNKQANGSYSVDVRMRKTYSEAFFSCESSFVKILLYVCVFIIKTAS